MNVVHKYEKLCGYRYPQAAAKFKPPEKTSQKMYVWYENRFEKYLKKILLCYFETASTIFFTFSFTSASILGPESGAAINFRMSCKFYVRGLNAALFH